MATVEPLIQRLRSKPGIQTSQVNDAWKVRFAAPAGFFTELTIAEEAIEWFVTVHSEAGAPVWSDWCDYLGYEKNQDPAKELAAMVSDIEWFVDTMAEVKGFRVWSEPVFRKFGITLGRHKVAEWLRHDRWQRVALSDVDLDSSLPPMVRERQIA